MRARARACMRYVERERHMCKVPLCRARSLRSATAFTWLSLSPLPFPPRSSLRLSPLASLSLSKNYSPRSRGRLVYVGARSLVTEPRSFIVQRTRLPRAHARHLTKSPWRATRRVASVPQNFLVAQGPRTPSTAALTKLCRSRRDASAIAEWTLTRLDQSDRYARDALDYSWIHLWKRSYRNSSVLSLVRTDVAMCLRRIWKAPMYLDCSIGDC